MSTLTPWTEERIRFEKEFKPALARLVREHFPHWRVKELSLHSTGPDRGLEQDMFFRLVITDGIANMTLEDKP